MTTPRIIVGIDVGGTFTDIVAAEVGGRVIGAKVPTTVEPAEAVLQGLALVVSRLGRIDAITHGSTLVTNVIAERRGAKTALITTRGFRDVLEIGRQSREDLYDLRRLAKPAPLVPRHLRFEVTERIGPDGRVREALRLEEAEAVIEALRREGVDAVAISLLHAYANPAHERALGDRLRGAFRFVSCSSEVNAEFREYERTSTTVLNAYVMPVAARYLSDLTKALAERDLGRALYIVHSTGGMMSAAMAVERPLAMAASGPAAGVAAARQLLRQVGVPDGIAFDMGGTTTDVCLIHRGEAAVLAQRKLNGLPVRLPSVAVESIGAGGGSIAWIDGAGALKVGPRSARAVPGPACYGRGGTEPTVTDANLLLGYLNPKAVFGDAISLDAERSRRALEPLAGRLGLGLREAALGIVTVANANMVRALRMVSVQKGYDVRAFTLVAYGGAGPIHAGRLARLLEMPRAIVPAYGGLFSALGCAASDVRLDRVRTQRFPLDAAHWLALEAALAEVEAEVVAQLEKDGHPRGDIRIERSLDLRYAGQNYELEVPVPAGNAPAALAETARRFHEKHEMLYHYRTAEAIDCINLRVCAVVPSRGLTLGGWKKEAGDSRVGTQRAFFPETGEIDLPRYLRPRLKADEVVDGPAVVEDPWATCLLYPGQRGRMDSLGNLWIEEGR